MEVSIENLKINVIEENKTRGVYSFEPLPTGFGYTLGNALRRVLLTSIKGAAVTQIKVGGANHQFTTLPGVKEDIVELTMNIKKIRFALHSNNPVVATIKKKGAGNVTAADIEVSAEAEVMNKDLHIATLADSKSELNLELVIEPGVGYSPMEERQTSKIGVIVLDSLFSPIMNAHYSVEPTRFGGKTDLDKINLTIETDGSISAKDAIKQAAKILRDYYDAFLRWELPVTEEIVDVEETSESDAKVSEDVAIEELPLQTRTINALKKHGIDSLHQLSNKSDEELADIKNLGEKSLEEIKKLLKKEGFSK
jgi:DNA-directed RNA polymerase subunit alpha